MTKTITVIDDSEGDRILLREELESKRYKVNEIDPSRHLLENLSDDNSDLIVIDMFMGVLNAFDVIRRLPKNKKIIVMSGLSESCHDLVKYGLTGRNIPLLDKGKLEDSVNTICQTI